MRKSNQICQWTKVVSHGYASWTHIDINDEAPGDNIGLRIECHVRESTVTHIQNDIWKVHKTTHCSQWHYQLLNTRNVPGRLGILWSGAPANLLQAGPRETSRTLQLHWYEHTPYSLVNNERGCPTMLPLKAWGVKHFQSFFLLLHFVICLKLRSDSSIGSGHPSRKTLWVRSSFYGSLARQSPLKPSNEYKKSFWWKL